MATEAQPQRLSLAFMRGHPAQAARVLEALPPQDAAALFARTPARLGADVLAAMLPQSAARCVAALDDERALELLSSMGAQPIVAVLRYLGEARRRELIKGLPTSAALASSLLLGYGEDTLGAWADPDVVVLPADTRAGDALKRMRQAATAHQVVFVADGQRKFAGQVSLNQLLQAPDAATLTTLMQPPAGLLAAHAPLSGSTAHPGWELASLLPVVEPGDRLIGVMTRDALARALRRATSAPVDDSDSRWPLLFARGYWQTLSGLIESGLTLLPRVAPARDAAEPAHER
jgi:magnesium transporter